MQFKCATNSGFISTFRLHFEQSWVLNLVQKMDGYGQLFGIETSALGPIAKCYDGKIYIGDTVFDLRMRY